MAFYVFLIFYGIVEYGANGPSIWSSEEFGRTIWTLALTFTGGALGLAAADYIRAQKQRGKAED